MSEIIEAQRESVPNNAELFNSALRGMVRFVQEAGIPMTARVTDCRDTEGNVSIANIGPGTYQEQKNDSVADSYWAQGKNADDPTRRPVILNIMGEGPSIAHNTYGTITFYSKYSICSSSVTYEFAPSGIVTRQECEWHGDDMGHGLYLPPTQATDMELQDLVGRIEQLQPRFRDVSHN